MLGCVVSICARSSLTLRSPWHSALMIFSRMGVARDRDAGTVQRYAQAQGYSFDITQDVAPLAAALAPRNLIPQTAVIGRDGRLLQLLPGEMFEEDVMELLDLAQRAEGAPATSPPKARS